MKKLTTLLAGILLAISVFAENVTVTINGNKNFQVVIDGKSYSASTFSTTTVNSRTLTITDLALGQHSIQVYRTTSTNRRTTVIYSSNFTLRANYDLKITVNGTSGKVKIAETRNNNASNPGNNSRTAMSDASFNQIYQTISRKWSPGTKYTEANNVFTTNTNYFTTDQIGQILSLITTESNRLLLAKKAYDNVVDPANYTQLYELFTTQSNRDELAAYIRTSTPANGTTRTAMSDVNFNNLYKSVNDQWSTTAKYSAINNAFTTTTNYFTVDQVGKIVSLITSETSRLQLVKNALDNVLTPANYTDLYDLFSIQANRSELDNYLRNNRYTTTSTEPVSNTTRVAMSDANFNTLYKSVSDQWSSNSKYTTINNAFTTSTNYFTVDQVGKIVSLVTSETSRLPLVKNALDNIVTPANYSDLYDLFSSEASRSDLDLYLRNNGYTTTSTAPVPNTARVVMSEYVFNDLYRSVNDQLSTSAKYNSVNNAFSTSTNYFNIYQVKQLVSLISSEDSRLQLVKNALDNIITPANYTELYDLFKSQLIRSELDVYLRNNGYTSTSTIPETTNVTKSAMTDATFNSLYQSIRSKYLPLGKFMAATDAFNISTNYFTTSQVKQIISLLSSETNRLQLAKNAYDNIVDPANIALLYDLFTSQASRDELDAYIRNYK
jgi:uncharacterized membrane protein YjjP (DUF1212 family)